MDSSVLVAGTALRASFAVWPLLTALTILILGTATCVRERASRVSLAARAIARYRLVDVTVALAAPQILQTMADVLIVLDVEGIVRVVNRAACEVFGRGEDDQH